MQLFDHAAIGHKRGEREWHFCNPVAVCFVNPPEVSARAVLHVQALAHRKLNKPKIIHFMNSVLDGSICVSETMPASELRCTGRTVYFRKAILKPNIDSDRVLARDAFEFVELWIRKNCTDALPYWQQARRYYLATRNLPVESSPLTSYYCFLNAVKALLVVKNVQFSELHGVSGDFVASKRALGNEKIKIQERGILGALSKYLQESEENTDHSLKDILSNIPFIHRSYRLTYSSHPELFIPVRNVVYRLHPNGKEVWLSANIEGRLANSKSLKTLPSIFEVDSGYKDACVIRTKQRINWYTRGASPADRNAAHRRLEVLHKECRKRLVFISAAPDLWYLKRDIAKSVLIERYGLTLIMAAMHRLSELSRYDPKGLVGYLERKENWLLTEFIENAPLQFIDELACELTNLEFGLPGIRPRTS